MNLTIKRALAEPTSNKQKLLYDEGSPLGVRIMPSGTRTWFCEVWVRPATTGERGRSVRRNIGSVNLWSADQARAEAVKMAGELLRGKDRLAEARQHKLGAKQASKTLADAVKDYIAKKRRGKDGLALKPRTTHAYLATVSEGGYLSHLAGKSIHRITAAEVRHTYEEISSRSEHSAAFAMRIFKAVMNWHGVEVENSPFNRSTPGCHRIVLKPTIGKPNPIPPEKLHAWWTAASARAGDPSADGCRFILLTGARPGEVFGGAFLDGLRVGSVDLKGGRVLFIDTKNRQDHTILLSHQALNIVRMHCANKHRTDKVFDTRYASKTLAAINKEAGVDASVTLHKLRHTFATLASELVTSFVLKRMMNHSDGADVTGAHYVGRSEAQLRAGWQVVADQIAPPASVIPLFEGRTA